MQVSDPSGVAVADDLLDTYRANGFVVLPNLLAPDDLAELTAELERLCRGGLGDVEGLPVGLRDAPADELFRHVLCLHFPHKLSAHLRDLAAEQTITDPLTRVIGPNVKLIQSMFFVKSEGKPGQAWHQDENFIPTRDRSLTGLWIAVDDATTENGCLWVIPGSHRRGVLYPDRNTDDERFDCTVESFGFPWTDADAVPVELPAGSAVLFDGYLLHRSLPNTTRRGTRRALVYHYMSAESRLPWLPPGDDSWMGRADLRDVLLVAGEDPYGYLPTVDHWRPHVRAAREGGCAR